MQAVIAFLGSQPFLLMFLVVGIGFVLGRLSYKGIGLGVTGATLLVGLLLSLFAMELGVRFELPTLVSSVFFNLFIFAIGLRVGPQFFATFGRGGKQIAVIGIFTVASAAGLALLLGKLLHLPHGGVAGVLAGAGTSTPAFGAAQSAVRASVDPDQLASVEPILTQQSTAFAIGYVVGMVGLVFFIKYLPQLFRSNARKAGEELQKELDEASPLEAPGVSLAYTKLMPAEADIRVFHVDRPDLIGRSVGELKKAYPRIVFEQLRRGDQTLAPDDDLRVQQGDEVALAGMVSQLIQFAPKVGPEIEDAALRDVEYETADVVVAKPELVGRPLQDVMWSTGHGCYLRALFRMGDQIPVQPELPLKHNDVLRVIGNPRHTQSLERVAGTAIRARLDTDILTIAIGLVVGSLIGALQVHIGGVEIGLGAAGGLMIAGIAISALRARFPALGGPVPESVRRMFEDVGVVIFVAVLGLNTGGTLPAAFAAGNLGHMLIAIVIVAFVPVVLGWVLGMYLFKVNAAILLGAIAGANQNSAALKTAEESTHSDGPALGFPVAFAVGTLALSIAAYIVALIE